MGPNLSGRRPTGLSTTILAAAQLLDALGVPARVARASRDRLRDLSAR
ncbi:hypothetical protein [Dactylosporangium sp. CA-139066]